MLSEECIKADMWNKKHSDWHWLTKHSTFSLHWILFYFFNTHVVDSDANCYTTY